METRLHSERTCKWLVAIQLVLTLALALTLVIGALTTREDREMLLNVSTVYSTVVVTIVAIVPMLQQPLIDGMWTRIATQILPCVEFIFGFLATYAVLVQVDAPAADYVARLAFVVAPFLVFVYEQFLMTGRRYVVSVAAEASAPSSSSGGSTGSPSQAAADSTRSATSRTRNSADVGRAAKPAAQRPSDSSSNSARTAATETAEHPADATAASRGTKKPDIGGGKPGRVEHYSPGWREYASSAALTVAAVAYVVGIALL